MILNNQKDPIEAINILAQSNRHSVMIEGPEGCGKSYLAMEYSRSLGISDFQVLEPKVDSLKSSIDSFASLQTPLVVCIENLDLGSSGASYSLLKFLEEPSENVYLVVTCRNIRKVPDTIISRSAVINVGPPTYSDLVTYGDSIDSTKVRNVMNSPVWRCARSFSDVRIILSMSSENLRYFDELYEICKFKDTVSNIVWNIGHYPDNSETPVRLVIQCIMDRVNTSHIRKAGVDCLNDLASKRVASHAAIAKFAFEAKYCE